MEKYTIVVLPKSPAARIIAALQPPIRKLFWEKIEELASSPVTVSQRAGFVSPKGGQLFRFHATIDETGHYFTVIFQFADTREENTLWVSDILYRIV